MISVTASRMRPASGATAPRKPRNPGLAVLVRQPLRVQLVMPHRRAEVPQDRVPVPEQQGVADHLVAERAADPGLRRVADVVEVEEQEGAALARLQRRPGPCHAVPAQPAEVDALLVVDPHLAGGPEGPHARRTLRRGHGAPCVSSQILPPSSWSAIDCDSWPRSALPSSLPRRAASTGPLPQYRTAATSNWAERVRRRARDAAQALAACGGCGSRAPARRHPGPACGCSRAAGGAPCA